MAIPTTRQRPFLVLRQTRQNRYTLPTLLGIIEKEGLQGQFRILLARSAEEIPIQIKSSPAIVGFSFMTPQIGTVREEVSRLRQTLPKETIFLAGGPHPTGDPKGTLAFGFDYIFAGEAERVFPLFLRQFLGGTRPSHFLIQEETGAPSLDDYPPFPSEGRYFSPIEITRGCLYHCHFCQTPRIFGPHPRHRSPQGVQKAIGQAVPRGFRQAFFRTPNAFAYLSEKEGSPNLAAMEELLQACRQGGVQGVHFGCFPSEVRPDWVTPEALDLIRKYCRNQTIVLGAQSGSDALLSRLKRKHTAREALLACQWIHRARFTPHVDFVFGFPGETPEDRRLSLALMGRMIEGEGARIHAHTYMPLPGTPLFWKEPTPLDDPTRNALALWEQRRKMDGWWREQEDMARKIIEWRDQGIIQSPFPREISIDS